jgi:hypothetical protein
MSGKWEGSVLTTEPPPLARPPDAQAAAPRGAALPAAARPERAAASDGGTLKAGRCAEVLVKPKRSPAL